VNGACDEACDEAACGDGECDRAAGESPESCAADCAWQPDCASLADCLGLPWVVRCVGHWSCEEGQCREACDGEGCGDDVCDAEAGETSGSCPGDCGEVPRCQGPADCLALPWLVDCVGHWGCPEGLCREVCDEERCGDGVCAPRGGESPESCPDDCVDACGGAGEPIWPPAACCEGLDAVTGCRPGDERCGPEPHFCVDCGDERCDPYESPYECRDDCPAGCALGDLRPFVCPEGGEVPWCACRPPRCRPECRAIGTRSEGWYDSCSGELIRFEQCGGCRAECRAIGTRSEGWYSGCRAADLPADVPAEGEAEVPRDELIRWDACAPMWACELTPELACGGGVAECETPADCLPLPWNDDCPGHWSCEAGACVPTCDAEGCGDEVCGEGESVASCAEDCAPACVGEGQAARPRVPCCDGLEALADCRPGAPCADDALFCVDCSDGVCDPHETPYTCRDDCPEGCALGEVASHTCENGDEVPWCLCEPPRCVPECKNVGTRSEGWYDSCTGERHRFGRCADCRLSCEAIGSRSEGWYADCIADAPADVPVDVPDDPPDIDERLVTWTACAPLWSCRPAPERECDGGGEGDPDCVLPLDCADQPWVVRCVGHWACDEGRCRPECDAEGCGDGRCNRRGGETPDSCAEDCRVEPQCAAPVDCLPLVWNARCFGHWACERGQCVEVCDAEGCGDGVCTPERGESEQSCGPDCAWQPECAAAPDCGDVVWEVDCTGHWSCEAGVCTEVCDAEGCGDGFCDREGGETIGSCAEDCAWQPECRGPVDCLEQDWVGDCLGHWGCLRGACVEVCDDELCGDGRCDPAQGETEATCADDCAEVMCVEAERPLPLELECCEGLADVTPCRPGERCPALRFCVDCGDERCGPYETVYNCLNDCREGCQVGASLTFECPGGAEVPWCTCAPARCKPECRHIGTRSEGWYDSCTGERYRWDQCGGCRAVCGALGTRSEGWYEQCRALPPDDPADAPEPDPAAAEERITWAACAPIWDCEANPGQACRAREEVPR